MVLLSLQILKMQIFRRVRRLELLRLAGVPLLRQFHSRRAQQ